LLTVAQRQTAWLAVLTGIAIVLQFGCGGEQATPTPTPQAAGPKGDGWAWNSDSWKRISGAGPSPRYAEALAYDAQRKVFVLFGGQTAKGSSDETWTWDGAAWKLQSPVHKPMARRDAAMAYDPAHAVVVLYGGHVQGREEGDIIGDTWTWNGTDWTEVDVGPGGPGKRAGTSIVTSGSNVVLFGGHYWNVEYSADAWTHDGHAWSRVDRAPRPAGRASSAVAWNPTDASLFVYGGSGLNTSAGIGAAGTPLADAWLLRGSTWTELTGQGPPALTSASAIWDQKGKRWTVLLGMSCPNPSDAAWGWNGTAWSKLASPGMPARWGAAVAQAPDGRALLFGGSDQSGC
jgi:hypothetical protein